MQIGKMKLKWGRFPALLLAGIVQRNGKIVIPSGNDCLSLGDDVIVVTTDTSLQDIHDICRE